MKNYKVEGFGFDRKRQIVPKSFITDDPLKLTRKLGIDKVSKLDTGEVIYDREKRGLLVLCIGGDKTLPKIRCI